MYYTRKQPVTTINNEQAGIELQLFAKACQMPTTEGRREMEGHIRDLGDYSLSPERRQHILGRIADISDAHAIWAKEYESLLIQYAIVTIHGTKFQSTASRLNTDTLTQPKGN